MTILPNAVYRVSAVPIKIPTSFFTKIEINIPEFIRNHKRAQMANTIPNKSNAGGAAIPDLRLLIQSLSSKNNMVPAQDRHVVQWHRTEDTNISPWNFSHLLDKDVRNTSWRKESIANKSCWKAFYCHSISSFAMCLFRFLTSTFFNFGDLAESRNSFISFRLSGLMEHRFLNFPQ